MRSRWGTLLKERLGRNAGAQVDFFSTRTVAVTGAGSGIGREMAVQLSRRGANLALADNDETGLNQTRQLCAASERVEIFCADVVDREALAGFAAGAMERFGPVDVLVTCAGILQFGTVVATAAEDFDTVTRVNFLGTVNTVKAFLPQMLAADRPARIAMLSSAVGLLAMANCAPYVASKMAIRGFAETLRAEMQMAETGVMVSCVYPGGVRTPIAQAALFAPDVDRAKAIRRFDTQIARTDPRDAAHRILSGIESGRARVLVGPDAWLAELAARMAGPHADKIVELAARLA